jgi:hypothetical protein
VEAERGTQAEAAGAILRNKTTSDQGKRLETSTCNLSECGLGPACALYRERMASALRLQRSTTGASARPRTSRPTQIDGIRAPRRIPGSITHSAHASGTARSIGQLLPTWKCQLNTANLRRYATGWPIKPELRVIKVFLTKWRRLGESWQMRLRGKANASRLRLFQPLLVDSPPAATRLAPYASALP